MAAHCHLPSQPGALLALFLLPTLLERMQHPHAVPFIFRSSEGCNTHLVPFISRSSKGCNTLRAMPFLFRSLQIGESRSTQDSALAPPIPPTQTCHHGSSPTVPFFSRTRQKDATPSALQASGLMRDHRITGSNTKPLCPKLPATVLPTQPLQPAFNQPTTSSEEEEVANTPAMPGAAAPASSCCRPTARPRAPPYAATGQCAS
jgi:hypothetical protein